MAYKASTTLRIGLPYFPTGVYYSAEADRRRFFYLDYNLHSYLGVVGVGVIDGWVISDAGGLNVNIAYGTAIVNGLFSESPFVVKNHTSVLPSDYVITPSYYVVTTGTADLNFYDAEIGQTAPPNPTTTTVYDKVLYSIPFALTDNADNYIYIYRNGVALTSFPYYSPNNVSPLPESATGIMPLYTAVAFGKTGSLSYAQSSGKAFIGKVVTRDGAIVDIDISKVSTLKNLHSTIVSYGQKLVDAHRHGGTGEFDPERIVLRTDTRTTALESATSNIVYKILYSEPTSVDLGHKHFYSIDSDGNGLTVMMIGSGDFHYHEISLYSVGNPVEQTIAITNHTHSLTVSAASPDSWDSNGDYQIYINDEAYYGTKATVSAEDKTITFTGDVTVVKKRYRIDKTFSDGSKYESESEEPSIFRFMLRISLDYYAKNSDAISNGTKPALILPDPASPVTLLKNQCIVAEQQLAEAGDTFVFSGEVAPDPVTVLLVAPGHTDKVGIEIVSNSEVTGKLRNQNVLYIPAEKFMTGEFSVGRIPILSHMGRYLEECYFSPVRATSYDGYVYESSGTVPWGNEKTVYASHIDSSQNIILGTSDGLYRYPANGAYLFIVNGVEIITSYGDFQEELYYALRQYSSKTGNVLNIKSDLYDSQIAAAEVQLSGYGTYFKITGDSRVIDGEVTYDTVNIFRIEGYKIPTFGYETERLENEILEGEEIVEEIIPETSSDDSSTSAAVQQRAFLVRNDFNKSTVKTLISEGNYVNQYGGLDRMYFAVASDYIAKTPDPDAPWNIVYQSSLFGYIGGVYRTYRGYYITFCSSGIYACTSTTSSEYKSFDLPSIDSVILASTFGFGDEILISYGSSLSFTDDYGKTWVTSNVSDSPFIKLFFDPTEDRTTITSSHYHSLSLNYAGNGYTSTVYDGSGTEIEKDHIHVVANDAISEVNGHTHSPIRIFNALNGINEIYRSYDGQTWFKYSDIPSIYGEIGEVTACFEKIIVCTEEKMIYTLDGITWITMSDFEGPIFSAQWDEDNLKMYFGGKNYFYSYDGTDVEIVKTLSGCGSPSIYVNDVRKLFNYTVNNYKRKIDFLGKNQSLNSVDTVFDFSKCYTLHGSWSPGTDYDLYVNDLLVETTRGTAFTTGEDIKATVNNAGYIDFGVSNFLENEISYGDDYLDVVSGTDFPASGYLRLTWTGDFGISCVFYQYSSKSGNRIYLTDPSEEAIPVTKEITDSEGNKTVSKLEVKVDLVSSFGLDDNILITIYEGKLTNVGLHTHEEIEDHLSSKNIGSPKTFADVYLSNLMHFTVALKYAISGVGEDYKNYFLSLFDYNDTPGDENNIDRFIDRYASDFFSQVMYSNSFSPVKSFKINKIIFGFGSFENLIFVATNIGLYVAKTNLGYEGNWFRVNIDDSLSTNDVLQAKDSLLFACTEKGFYTTSSSDLSVWTQYVEDVVGGIPTRINPRWSDISAYNNSGTYWWQGWQGVTHGNSSLVNSLFLSGDSFCSSTDDYGVTWQKGYIKDLSGNVIRSNYFFGDISLLSNGSSVCCLKNAATKKTSVICSTGSGASWNEIFEFTVYSGEINSYVVTDYNNVSLSVTYNGESSPSGKLRGLNLYCNGKEFLIIENSPDHIVVYGLEIIEVLSGNDDFSVDPATLNAIAELPGGNLSIGTSNGILTDRGIYLANSDKSSGVVKNVGVKAAVTSLNIKGRIKAVIFSTSERTMISASLNIIVKNNVLAGYKLKFSGLSDMEVISNEESKTDGSAIIVTKCDWNAIPTGLDFSAASTDNRLYVEFDNIVKSGELAGGKLYVGQESGGITSIKSSLPGFDIISNTSDSIEIRSDGTDDTFSWEDLFADDTVVYSSLSDKTVPVYVDFTEIPQIGALKGNYAVFKNVSDNIPSLSVRISNNTENAIYVPVEVIAAIKSVSGTYTNGVFVTYSCIFDGNTFSLNNASFESDDAFNLKSTSIVLDHYHSVLMYGKTIEGMVSSLGENTGVYVDINVDAISDLAQPPFLGRPTLLEGNDMVLYDPVNYSRTYRVEIISTSDTVIRVKRNGDIFNISGTDSEKISAGFKLMINANLYGVSSSTGYTENFVIKRDYLTSPTYVEGQTFNVPSTSGLFVGNSVSIKDRSGLEFKTKISSIPGPTSFVVEDESLFDFKTTKDSYYEAYYGTIEIGTSVLTATALWDTYSVTVADTSVFVVGDTVTLKDNKGQMFVSKVDNIISPVVFETEDKINANFTVANESYVLIKRANFSENHTHLIKEGEFEKVANADWQKRGYAFSHGHSVAPFIKDVLDVKTMHGKAYVCGNSAKIYVTDDSGYSWKKEVDLLETGDVSPVPSKVQTISTDGYSILFGCDSGAIVYHSVLIPSSVVPLERPLG